MAGFKSERWPVIDRNAARLQIGIRNVACGVCVRLENAPVAVILWADDLGLAMPLLDPIERAVRLEVQTVVASAARLSDREVEVIAMSADGFTSAEIGRVCEITETTVNAHIASAMKKTNARSRTHLVSIAIRNGYI